jgi:hypothetical protein
MRRFGLRTGGAKARNRARELRKCAPCHIFGMNPDSGSSDV